MGRCTRCDQHWYDHVIGVDSGLVLTVPEMCWRPLDPSPTTARHVLVELAGQDQADAWCDRFVDEYGWHPLEEGGIRLGGRLHPRVRPDTAVPRWSAQPCSACDGGEAEPHGGGCARRGYVHRRRGWKHCDACNYGTPLAARLEVEVPAAKLERDARRLSH